ncbi:MAG TPA: hypothetical protein VFS72_08605 [Agromyces sp.]|nr:hypothetical protein [Agromyces sp.]
MGRADVAASVSSLVKRTPRPGRPVVDTVAPETATGDGSANARAILRSGGLQLEFEPSG